MTRAATFRSLADIAEDQWGLVTRRQAEATGVAWTTLARMAKNGVVERVGHGVYRLRGTPADEYLSLRAAWLQLAPETPVWDRRSAVRRHTFVIDPGLPQVTVVCVRRERAAGSKV